MAQALDRATLRAIAERALDEWDICAVELELISISENTVFRVDTNTGETYVLRIHRPGYHTLAELNSEQQWTAALKRAGIGVPLPRLTRDCRGYAIVSVPGSIETRHVGIVEWFEGVTLSSIMAQAPDDADSGVAFRPTWAHRCPNPQSGGQLAGSGKFPTTRL